MYSFKLLQEKYLHGRNEPGGGAGQRQVSWEGQVPTLAGSSAPGGLPRAGRPVPGLMAPPEGTGDHPPEGTGEKTTPPPSRGSAHFHALNTPSPPPPSVAFLPEHCALLNAPQQNRQLPKTRPAGAAGRLHSFTQNPDLLPRQQDRSRVHARGRSPHRAPPPFLSHGTRAGARRARPQKFRKKVSNPGRVFKFQRHFKGIMLSENLKYSWIRCTYNINKRVVCGI